MGPCQHGSWDESNGAIQRGFKQCGETFCNWLGCLKNSFICDFISSHNHCGQNLKPEANYFNFVRLIKEVAVKWGGVNVELFVTWIHRGQYSKPTIWTQLHQFCTNISEKWLSIRRSRVLIVTLPSPDSAASQTLIKGRICQNNENTKMYTLSWSKKPIVWHKLYQFCATNPKTTFLLIQQLPFLIPNNWRRSLWCSWIDGQ